MPSTGTEMKLTQEQLQIINSKGDIKINAVAGSGKTTTVIAYAQSRPLESRILYLAFNKSVKLEADKRFREQGLSNVKVETAHSLAYKHIVFAHQYRVKSNGYQSHEVVNLLKLRLIGEKHAEYILANHILKVVSLFCNSDRQKVNELNYIETVREAKARTFVRSHYAQIERYARELLAMMNSGAIEITHDFYLKKFQLAQPALPYDYILFDEGQDASAAMLDVFLKQRATKVIVGDTHQQIYGWRYAVNSLERVPFPTFHLSTSFRFHQDIADLATQTLARKSILKPFDTLHIIGGGKANLKAKKNKAIIARTNLTLLLKAIEYVTDKKEIKHIYFEGNINSYTYAEEGASLYDVLNLMNGKIYKINDPLIKSMGSMGELEDYIEQTEDVQLGMMVELVNEYGNDIYDIIKSIKDKHVQDHEKDKAQLIFSTVHRCKGMEYDQVQILNDFVPEEKLRNMKNNMDEQDVDLDKLNEEINLLYVAVTRAKYALTMPEVLMPKNFPESTYIQVLKQEKVEDKRPQKSGTTLGYGKTQSTFSKSKTTAHKSTYPEATTSWSTYQDKELTRMYFDGTTINDMSKHFGRTKGAIASRIKKLKLEEQY
ncbi:MAG TPA: UvrD-helicase domain-containing protein [Cytophagales bacterium]|nr:UvrD-helicase domain-containing protein [Cytophagales bacterium]